MTKKLKPNGVLSIQPFNVQVAVFNNLDRLQKYHTHVLGEDPIADLNQASYGMCISEIGRTGEHRFYLYFAKDANRYIRIHECSHLVDFVMDAVGVPISIENTEIRAYLLGETCQQLDEVLK